MLSKTKILLDPGHGVNTPGKRSPDGSFREYAYAREIADSIATELNTRGFDAEILVPEEYDVSLRERVRRANAWCSRLGPRNVCLVSIHTNAAGNGSRWMTARGWSCYTSRGQTAGDRLADCLYKAATIHLPGHRLRHDLTDGDLDLESNFTILSATRCPAALTENLYHDNAQDVAFLESDEGKRAITALHVEGIIQYINQIA